MSRFARFNLAQRIVLVIGLGAAMACLGRFLVGLGHVIKAIRITQPLPIGRVPFPGGVSPGGVIGGKVPHALPAAARALPGANIRFQVPALMNAGSGLPAWARLLIWLGVICVWVVGSILVFRTTRPLVSETEVLSS